MKTKTMFLQTEMSIAHKSKLFPVITFNFEKQD